MLVSPNLTSRLLPMSDTNELEDRYELNERLNSSSSTLDAFRFDKSSLSRRSISSVSWVSLSVNSDRVNWSFVDDCWSLFCCCCCCWVNRWLNSAAIWSISRFRFRFWTRMLIILDANRDTGCCCCCCCFCGWWSELCDVVLSESLDRERWFSPVEELELSSARLLCWPIDGLCHWVCSFFGL